MYVFVDYFNAKKCVFYTLILALATSFPVTVTDFCFLDLVFSGVGLLRKFCPVATFEHHIPKVYQSGGSSCIFHPMPERTFWVPVERTIFASGNRLTLQRTTSMCLWFGRVTEQVN